MGRKADATRARIIEAALPLFNTKGYAGTSISDILEAAEIQKGGLYRHFESKDELALEAFDFAVERLLALYLPAMGKTKAPLARLHACIDAAANSLQSPPVPGGCPIMNAAIEADGTDEPLRRRAARAMTIWHETIREAVRDGVADNSIHRSADPDAVASVLTSSLEGAIMLSVLYRKLHHMSAVAAHLHGYVDNLAASKKVRRKRT